MNETKTPKGVKFSFFIMSFPLLFNVGHLALLAPMMVAGSGVDPANFAHVGRTCLRLLALNISFIVSHIQCIIL